MQRFRNVLIAMLLLIGLNACSSDSEEIEFVKNGKLDICPNSTIEQMLNEGISSPSWEYDTENGYVNVSGDIYFEGLESTGIIQFKVDFERKFFEYHTFEFNGKTQDNTMASAFFNYICPDVSTIQASEPEKRQEVKKPQKSPIKMRVEQAYNEAWKHYYPKIIITSLSDKINIEDVMVNKGNCKFSNSDMVYIKGRVKTIKLIPKILKYGETLEIRLQKSCHLLRVDIDTDQDSWSFEF